MNGNLKGTKIMKRFVSVPLYALLTMSLIAPAFAQNAVPRVGVANAAKVFSEIQEVKDLRAKMENQNKVIAQQKLEKQQKLNDLKNARDALKPDAPAFGDKNRELMQEAISYQVWEKMVVADTDRDQKQQMLAIFSRITATVAEIATSKQIDIVLAEQRPDLPENLDQINLDQVRALIISRNVLFANGAVDITNDVIAGMDAKYKAGK